MTTINVTSVFIHILLFFIIYNIIYWFYTLNESEKDKKLYRVLSVFASLFMTTAIILVYKVLYILYSHTHFTFTF